MGQLQDLVLETALVVVSPKGGIEVRGLSPYDLTALFLRHRGELSGMFDQFAAKVKGGSAVGVEDASVMTAGVLETAPDIVAEVIALACGSDPQDSGYWDDVTKCRSMSIGIQADALQKIGGLTFSSEMPPKKFFEIAVSAMRSTTATLNQNTPPA